MGTKFQIFKIQIFFYRYKFILCSSPPKSGVWYSFPESDPGKKKQPKETYELFYLSDGEIVYTNTRPISDSFLLFKVVKNYFPSCPVNIDLVF